MRQFKSSRDAAGSMRSGRVQLARVREEQLLQRLHAIFTVIVVVLGIVSAAVEAGKLRRRRTASRLALSTSAALTIFVVLLGRADLITLSLLILFLRLDRLLLLRVGQLSDEHGVVFFYLWNRRYIKELSKIEKQ